MTKKAKLITIITSAVLAVALITLAICLIVANSNREKTETSIVTCSINPQVQFVLNGNDKVMTAVALNDEAKGIVLSASFEGMKYSDALNLFVSKSVDAGYLDINTAGTTISISFSGLKEDYTKLKDTVVKEINKYFDDNGIIAGVIAGIEDLKDSVKTLKPTANNVDDESDQELMEHYLNIWENVKDIKPSNFASFFNAYDITYNEYLDTIESSREAIELREQEIAVLDTEIATLQAEVNALAEGSAERIAKQAELNAKLLEKQIKNTNIQTLQKLIDSDAYNNFITEFSRILESYTNNKANEATALKNLFEQKVKDAKASIDEHKAEFEANKAETLAKIEEYRKSLEK